MISVVIPTLNAEARLPHTLVPLVTAAMNGLLRQVIIVDGGSTDATEAVVDAAGAEWIRSERGRGAQLAAGAGQARSDWILFLHDDTALEAGWDSEVRNFIERVERGGEPLAAAFRFALDDFGARPRLLEALVAFRCMVFRMPYGDQGLLIPRRLYQSIGGFRPLPLMEDADLAWRLGRRRLVMLRSRAVTSAMRYKRNGYFKRMVRNISCLTLYWLNVPQRVLIRLYG